MSSKTFPAANQDQLRDISGPKLLETHPALDISGPGARDRSVPERSPALRHVKTSTALRHVKTSPALGQVRPWDKSGPKTSQDKSGPKIFLSVKKLASLNWPLFIGPSLSLSVQRFIVGFVDLQLDKFGHESIGLSFTCLSALSSLLPASLYCHLFYWLLCIVLSFTGHSSSGLTLSGL